MAPPRGTEVVVRVAAAGVNGGCETFRCRGEHFFARNREATDGFAVGAEGAGVVVAVGGDVAGVAARNAAWAEDADGAPVSVGDVVAFVGGAFAEYVTLPSPERALRVATSSDANRADAREAAALYISGTIALCALYHRADTQPGERVVVTAAAGGTGQFAVQLALLRGCHVIATCGSERKRAALEALCAHLIDHASGVGFARVCQGSAGGSLRFVESRGADIRGALRGALDAAGGDADVAYEGVGGHMRDACMDVLCPKGGRLLVIGYISEYPHNDAPAASADGPVPASEELFWSSADVSLPGGARVLGNVWGNDVAGGRRDVYALWRSGDLKVLVDDVGGDAGGGADVAERARRAVHCMLGGGTVGKAVLRP